METFDHQQFSFELSELCRLRSSSFEDFLVYLGVGSEAADVVCTLADNGAETWQAAVPSPTTTALARESFATPLPPNWSEQVEQDTSRVYFYNAVTAESRWCHPLDSAFRELLAEIRRWAPENTVEDVAAASDAHLREFRERAVASLAHWSGPYTASGQAGESSPELTEKSEATERQEVPEAEYYFNVETQESAWEHPAQPLEFELYVRFMVLSRCLVAHERRRGGLGACGHLGANAVNEQAGSGLIDGGSPPVAASSSDESDGDGLVSTSLARCVLRPFSLTKGSGRPTSARATSKVDSSNPSLSMRSDPSSVDAYFSARSVDIADGDCLLLSTPCARSGGSAGAA